MSNLGALDALPAGPRLQAVSGPAAPQCLQHALPSIAAAAAAAVQQARNKQQQQVPEPESGAGDRAAAETADTGKELAVGRVPSSRQQRQAEAEPRSRPLHCDINRPGEMAPSVEGSRPEEEEQKKSQEQSARAPGPIVKSESLEERASRCEPRASEADHNLSLDLEGEKFTNINSEKQEKSSSSAHQREEDKLQDSPAWSSSQSKNNEKTNMCCATRRPAGYSLASAFKRIPKRKLSVFSHDGFPSLQLLDQQNLRVRAAAIAQAAEEQQRGELEEGREKEAAYEAERGRQAADLLNRQLLHRHSIAMASQLRPMAASEAKAASLYNSVADCAMLDREDVNRQLEPTTSTNERPLSQAAAATPVPAAATNASLKSDDQHLHRRHSAAPGDTLAAGADASSAAAAVSQVRRSARLDTLGSTGSSRASSCDEPTISTPGSSGCGSASSLAGAKLGGAGACKAPAVVATQAASEGAISAAPTERRLMMTPTDDASSSSSSLDSIQSDIQQALERAQIGPSLEAAGERSGGQSAPAKCSSKHSSASNAENQTTTNLPPFESIRTQLKANSMPNAQTIQRHIDNLISQNEAIVENWNFVSIRSYTSSSASAPTSANSSQTTQAPSSRAELVKRASTGLAPAASSEPARTTTTTTRHLSTAGLGQRQPSAALASLARAPGQEGAAGKLRWSTAMMLGPAFVPAPLSDERHSGLQRAARGERAPALTSAASLSPQSSGCSSGSSLEVSMTPQLQAGSCDIGGQQQALSMRLKQLELQRQRAHSLALMAAPLEQQLMPGPREEPQPGGESLQESHLHLHQVLAANSIQGQQHGYAAIGQLDPVQLESAIQRLSLAKKEDEFLQQQNNNNHYNQHLFHAHNELAHITTPCYHGHRGDQFQRQQDLTLNEQYHEREDQILMAALLMERQCQQQQQAAAQESAGLGRRTSAGLLLQQQQNHMIERRMEQIRLSQLGAAASLASLEQQRQNELDMAMAASSGPAILAFIQQRQQQQLAEKQLANSPPAYLREQQALESQLLRDFLAKMLPVEEHKHLVSLEHGTELLTQSLDSATPLHRCEACDISFWTRDLLNYHMMTQCVIGRATEAKPGPPPPLAFCFGRDGGQQHEMEQQEHFKPISKSVSPPAYGMCGATAAGDQLMRHHNHQRHLLPRTGTHMNGSNYGHQEMEPLAAAGGCRVVRDDLRANQQLVSDLSAVKHQQLNNSSSPLALPHESLPFKKRKISEPNMRY